MTAIEVHDDGFYSLKNRQKLIPQDRYGICKFMDYEPQSITRQFMKQMIKRYTINRSSHSHAIFKIECDEIQLAIVDFYGFDKNKPNIPCNNSFTVLNKCIHAFCNNNIVPFMESRLTQALMQYFSPHHKIYMIAHINRSTLMLPENIKVLQDTALNSKIIKSNQKSFQICDKKRKIQSCLKSKALNPEDQIASNGIDIRQTKNGEQTHQKYIQCFEGQAEQFQKNRKILMERYINEMIVRNEQFDYYLDCQFQKEDQNDRKFIEELNNTKYFSPKKINNDIDIQLAKAQSRIRLWFLDGVINEKMFVIVDLEKEERLWHI